MDHTQAMPIDQQIYYRLYGVYLRTDNYDISISVSNTGGI